MIYPPTVGDSLQPTTGHRKPILFPTYTYLSMCKHYKSGREKSQPKLSNHHHSMGTFFRLLIQNMIGNDSAINLHLLSEK